MSSFFSEVPTVFEAFQYPIQIILNFYLIGFYFAQGPLLAALRKLYVLMIKPWSVCAWQALYLLYILSGPTIRDLSSDL